MLTIGIAACVVVQKNLTAPCSEGHIVNIGTIIEDMENTLRNQLDQVYDGISISQNLPPALPSN